MLYDHRTYTLKPLKMGKRLTLYEECALPVQQKYLGNLIGFFQSETGELNQVVHLWGFTDLNDRARHRAQMEGSGLAGFLAQERGTRGAAASGIQDRRAGEISPLQ